MAKKMTAAQKLNAAVVGRRIEFEREGRTRSRVVRGDEKGKPYIFANGDNLFLKRAGGKWVIPYEGGNVPVKTYAA